MSDYLLVHGAYQGGWIWRRVVERLRAGGDRAIARSLDGCGERSDQIRQGISTESHAQEIARLLFFEDLRDVTLVGTSSGGMVVAKAAELARPRIRRLVFVDALVLMPGEKIRDIVTRPASIEGELAVGPSPEDAANRLFADLDEETRRWAVERCTLHPAAVFHQPVKLKAFWEETWKASVIYCRRAPNPGEAHQRRCADRLNARWHELDTGHYPMLTEPDALTELIRNG